MAQGSNQQHEEVDQFYHTASRVMFPDNSLLDTVGVALRPACRFAPTALFLESLAHQRAFVEHGCFDG